ncbi:MAG: extracellular solute-binding protein [Spirochaetaceae bacterium]
MKKVATYPFTLLLFVAFAVGSLFAGGGQEEGTRSTAQEAGGGEDATIVTIGYNRFLTSSFGPGPAPIDAIKEAVADRYPDIQVELSILPDTTSGMRDAISVWMTAQDGTVDIYGIDMPWVPEFGRAGWALPLGGELPQLRDDFIDSGLDVFSHEGDILGVPFWGSISGMYFRSDLLEEYELEVPESYTEMQEAMDVILADRPELAGLTWPAGKGEWLIMVFSDFLYGFGGSYTDGEGNYAFDSPEAIQALQFMVGLIEGGYTPVSATAWNGEEAQRPFVAGDAIFNWGNSDMVIWLDDPERSQVVGKWGFTTSPAEPEGEKVGITGGFAFSVNPYTDTRDETLKVMEVISDLDVQKAFAVAWGPVQYYDGLYENEEVLEANPNADRITAVLDSAKSRPPSVRYSQLSSILQEEIHAALTGGKAPRRALEAANERVNALQ